MTRRHCCCSLRLLFHVGPHDRFAEGGRRSSRHRHRDSVPSFSKTMAKQFMKEVEHACSSFSIRIVYTWLESLSTLGWSGLCGACGACGHQHGPHSDRVVRGRHRGLRRRVSSFHVEEFLEVPRLRRLLPFARKSHSTPSCHTWEDSETGASNLALLFSLAIHNALEEVKGQMQERELLFVFPG